MTATITDEEIESLPRSAQIAFSARCARRVERLIERRWPAVPRYQKRVIREMIEVAEGCTLDNARALASGLSSSIGFRKCEKSLFKAAAFAAVHSAYKAAETRSPTFALRAADFTARALTADHSPAAQEELRALRHDYETFANRIKNDEWLGTAEVGPEVFGPLEADAKFQVDDPE